MSDSVKKIFTIIIVVVVCIVIGAFVINILVPNALTQTVNVVEDTMYSATGIRLDLNGDGVAGTSIDKDGNVRDDNLAQNQNGAYENANQVEGFNVNGGGGSGDTN